MPLVRYSLDSFSCLQLFSQPAILLLLCPFLKPANSGNQTTSHRCVEALIDVAHCYLPPSNAIAGLENRSDNVLQTYIFRPVLLFTTNHQQHSPTSSNIATMVHTLPFANIQVPSPGFGAMGISFGLGNNLTLEQAEPVLLKAIELGCTFWDTAVVYQAGVNEKLLGDFIRKHQVRDKLFSMSSHHVCYRTATLTNAYSRFKMRVRCLWEWQRHQFRRAYQDVHRRHH